MMDNKYLATDDAVIFKERVAPVSVPMVVVVLVLPCMVLLAFFSLTLCYFTYYKPRRLKQQKVSIKHSEELAVIDEQQTQTDNVMEQQPPHFYDFPLLDDDDENEDDQASISSAMKSDFELLSIRCDSCSQKHHLSSNSQHFDHALM
ncbi:hypothetical protein GPALN_006429 [Globodera pallida]|nr:hypothetical protein GPALN_006429 [Globodera pallida]